MFKALKGGGNNFGVVTRFDFKTFDQGLFWGGFVSLPLNDSQSQLQALQDFTTNSGNGMDDFAALESIFAFNASGQTSQAAIVVETRKTPYSPIFNAIASVQPQVGNDFRFTNCSNLSVEASPGLYTERLILSSRQIYKKLILEKDQTESTPSGRP